MSECANLTNKGSTMNLSKSMKIAMAKRGINQTELASASGISAGTISKLSQSKGGLSMDTVERIAGAMDYSLGEFIALGE